MTNAGHTLSFRILGPVELVVDGQPVPVGPPQQRAVLALLLLDVNAVVPADRLVGAVWDDAPPPSARNLLQGYVSHLRRALAPFAAAGVRLVTRTPGYVLESATELIDAERFKTLRRMDGDPPEMQAAALREALALWRGPALADVAGLPGLADAAARLDELRLITIEDRVEADLALGREAELAAELPELIGQHPYRERLHAQLIVALYRSGRQVDALAAYRAARAHFVAELGIEPGPELKRLESAVLRHDPALAPGVSVTPGNEHVEHGPARETPAEPPARRRHRVAVAVAAVAALLAVVALAGTRGDDHGAPLNMRPGSIGFVGVTGRLERVLPATRQGGPLTIAGGSAWVGDQSAKTVTEVDLARGTTQSYGVGAPPSAVVAGGGSVWVAGGYTGTVTRVLPDEGFVGAPFRPTSTSKGKLALSLQGETLWVGAQDQRLAALETGGLDERRSIELPGGPRAIAVTPAAIWVLIYGSDEAIRVDAVTGALRRGGELGGQPVALAATTDGVWVATRGDNRVWQIDARTGDPLAAIPVGEPPTALAVAAGAVWIGGAAGTLARIDPRAGSLVGSLRLGRPIAALAPDAGGVWVSAR